MADDPADRSRAYASAGALITDGAGRVMLVEPTYKQAWEIPGGYLEAGETPVEGCARELREELGLDIAVGRLLAVDWAPLSGEGDKVLFVFDGGTLSAADLDRVVLQADELASYQFVEPADVTAVLIPRLGRRVAAAVEARRTGATAYLEYGLPRHP